MQRGFDESLIDQSLFRAEALLGRAGVFGPISIREAEEAMARAVWPRKLRFWVFWAVSAQKPDQPLHTAKGCLR